MVNSLQNEYQPDSVSAPGETLAETLDTLGMSQTELAKRMGRPIKTINEIIQGKAAITPETALQLEQVLSVPASFWLKLEQHYREALARLNEEQRLCSWIEWIKAFPVREMIHRGWLPSCNSKPQQVFEVLKFFGVASPDAWKEVWEHQVIRYRRSPAHHNIEAVTTWLRQGEIQAQAVETKPYNADVFRNSLIHIRSLTVKPVNFFQKELVRLCADAGVVVVFVPELPGTGICGATRWLTPTKALIQLSLRYKTDDQLWFTFFHEAGHILLHGKRKLFLDLEIDHKSNEEHETQANTFAADMLVDPTEWRQFVAHRSYCKKVNIQTFAQRMGIAPGIIVGRLQHEKLLPFDYCNSFKHHLEWKQDPHTHIP